MSSAFYSTEVDGLRLLNVTRDEHKWRYFHDWYAIPMFFSGSAEMTYRGRWLCSVPGHVNVLEPGEVHTTNRVTVPVNFAVVFVPAPLFEGTAAELGYRGLPHFDPRGEYRDARLEGAALAFMELTESGHIDAESSLTNLVGCLLEAIAERPYHPRLPANHRAFEAVLEAACAGGTCPSIGELASLSNVSERQLHRSFRQSHGVSPVELFQLARVSRAMRGISGAATLTELAAECGFADLSHMNRVFQRVVGRSSGHFKFELLQRVRARGKPE